MTAAELAGGFGLPGADPLSGRIEGIFERRLAPLPEMTRLLLLLAAAEPTGDPALLWRAAGNLGLNAEDAVAPAEADGLLTAGTRVIFRHPLVRSAVYQTAPAADRRRAHRALAEATDPGTDPDRRAWHRAQAAAGPDEDIAAELERSASRAQACGGFAAAGHGSDAPPLLLMAARQFEPLDVRLARETYLEALSAALFAGRLAVGGGVREVAAAARAAPLPPRPARAADLLLDGLALVITEGYPAGVPMLRQAVSSFRSADVSGEEELRWIWQACHGAALLWDYGSWDLLSARRVELARAAGALTALPIAFNTRAGVHLFAGEFDVAASLVAQVESVTEATGSSIAPYAALGLAACRGQEVKALELIEAATKDAQRRGEGGGLSFARWATAVLCNSLGRYEQALAAAQQASEDSPADLFANWAAAELIEAAARSGVPELAANALNRLSATAFASGSDWTLGVEARSRALLSEGETVETLYREAIDRLGRTRLRVELGRAHLLYGEWLRRENRRIDAREQLRTAHQMFAAMGADGFAERAARELLATGERVRKRTADAPGRLTAREAQIARLAGDGLSNPEIAARLFMSPRTVEYHLHKVFTKLAISSRNQLHAVLASRRNEGWLDEPRV